VLKISISSRNTSFQTLKPFNGVIFGQCLSAAAHVTHQSSTVSVRSHHESSSEYCRIVFFRFYSHRIQIWSTKAASYLERWIL